MKSVLEVITILVFLLIITLFQKMDEGGCDSAYNTANYPYPSPIPSTKSSDIIPALYKDVQNNAKPARSQSPARNALKDSL